MSSDFTLNNQYVQVGVNHGNIYTCTDRISVTHSQDTLTSNVGGKINSATTTALLQALVKARRCLDVVQHAASQNNQILGVAERLGSLLLDIKELRPEQWGSLENGVISYNRCLFTLVLLHHGMLRAQTYSAGNLVSRQST